MNTNEPEPQITPEMIEAAWENMLSPSELDLADEGGGTWTDVATFFKNDWTNSSTFFTFNV